MSNNASLAGTLDIKLLGGFIPTVGETFDFLTYGGTLGSNSLNVVGLDTGYTYSANIANGVGILTVLTAVPEASTLLSTTLMLGAAGLLIRRQRRTQNAGLPPTP